MREHAASRAASEGIEEAVMAGRWHGNEIYITLVGHSKDRFNDWAFKAFDLLGCSHHIHDIGPCISDMYQLEGVACDAD
jgi:hypothetical protein